MLVRRLHLILGNLRMAMIETEVGTWCSVEVAETKIEIEISSSGVAGMLAKPKCQLNR